MKKTLVQRNVEKLTAKRLAKEGKPATPLASKPIKTPSAKAPPLVITDAEWQAIRATPPKAKTPPAPVVKTLQQLGAEDAQRLLARGSGAWRQSR
jgi:hypothetical protein